MAENNLNNQEQLDENHLIAIRKEKLKELQEQGKDPFKITKYLSFRLSRKNTGSRIESVRFAAFPWAGVRLCISLSCVPICSLP